MPEIIAIYHDELYPYFGWHRLESNINRSLHTKTVEVSDEFFKELEDITEKFFVMQEKLKELKEGK